MSSISHNMGEFKLIKADVNINKKNFIGYTDGDYDMVNQFHKNNIDFATKNNSFFNSSIFVGYDLTNKDVSRKVFDISSSNQKFVNINYETNLHNNLYVNKNMYVKENAFFNNNIFISNCMVLEEEEIVINTNKKFGVIYDFDNKFITLGSYKILLSNIINKVKSNIINKSPSLNFVTNQKNSYYSQSIMSVNKRFIIGSEETQYINCFLLVYVIKINNRIITCKPVLDTFIIIDSNDEEVQINDELSE